MHRQKRDICWARSARIRPAFDWKPIVSSRPPPHAGRPAERGAAATRSESMPKVGRYLPNSTRTSARWVGWVSAVANRKRRRLPDAPALLLSALVGMRPGGGLRSNPVLASPGIAARASGLACGVNVGPTVPRSFPRHCAIVDRSSRPKPKLYTGVVLRHSSVPGGASYPPSIRGMWHLTYSSGCRACKNSYHCSHRCAHGSRRMIRVGVAGLGKMGLSQLAMIRPHPDVEVAGVCDTTGYVVDVLEKYTGVRAFSGFEAMLDAAALDAVLISTPSRFHAGMVRTALERGLHVFCEKPFVLDPVEGEELARVAESKGLVNQVGYHYRFVAAFQE